jgi:hypothetical protein
MAGRPQQFKHRDVTRAVRAASAAGVHASEVKVVLPTGATIIISGKPDAVAAVKPGKASPASRSSRAVR